MNNSPYLFLNKSYQLGHPYGMHKRPYDFFLKHVDKEDFESYELFKHGYHIRLLKTVFEFNLKAERANLLDVMEDLDGSD